MKINVTSNNTQVPKSNFGIMSGSLSGAQGSVSGSLGGHHGIMLGAVGGAYGVIPGAVGGYGGVMSGAVGGVYGVIPGVVGGAYGVMPGTVGGYYGIMPGVLGGSDGNDVGTPTLLEFLSGALRGNHALMSESGCADCGMLPERNESGFVRPAEAGCANCGHMAVAELYYGTNMEVTGLKTIDGHEHIAMKSKARKGVCPCCGTESTKTHGWWDRVRVIQDFSPSYPGVSRMFYVKPRRFVCEECGKTFVEELLFARKNQRFTPLINALMLVLSGMVRAGR